MSTDVELSFLEYVGCQEQRLAIALANVSSVGLLVFPACPGSPSFDRPNSVHMPNNGKSALMLMKTYLVNWMSCLFVCKIDLVIVQVVVHLCCQLRARNFKFE